MQNVSTRLWFQDWTIALNVLCKRHTFLISSRKFKITEIAWYYSLLEYVLHYLHWLPVELRVDCKALHDQVPPYIYKIVTKSKPRRQLRSISKCMFVVLKIRTKGYGVRSFCISNVIIIYLNYLSDDRLKEADSVVIFKGRLKTHIVKSYFSSATGYHSFLVCHYIYSCLYLRIHFNHCVFSSTSYI